MLIKCQCEQKLIKNQRINLEQIRILFKIYTLSISMLISIMPLLFFIVASTQVQLSQEQTISRRVLTLGTLSSILSSKQSGDTSSLSSSLLNRPSLLERLLASKPQQLDKNSFMNFLEKCDVLQMPVTTHTHEEYSIITDLPDISISYSQFLDEFQVATSQWDNQIRKYRELVYYNNINMINQYNKESDRSFNFYINQFADLKQDQFRARYATLKPQEAQYDQIRTRMLQTQNIQKKEKIDWSCYTGGIDSQGTCGACYAFVASDIVASMFAIHLTTFHIKLSVQELVSCSPSILEDGCKGGLFQNSFDYIKRNGLTTAMDYPYQSAFVSEPPTCNQNKQKSKEKRKITTYKPITRNCQSLIMQLNKGPIAVGINSYGLQFYSSGVYKQSPMTITDHAVLLVGYDPKIGFKIKNIWGKTWGIQGYAWISESQHSGLCSRAIGIDIPGQKSSIKSCKIIGENTEAKMAVTQFQQPEKQAENIVTEKTQVEQPESLLKIEIQEPQEESQVEEVQTASENRAANNQNKSNNRNRSYNRNSRSTRNRRSWYTEETGQQDTSLTLSTSSSSWISKWLGF